MEGKMFSNTDLRKLIIPLVLDLLLAVLVGVADTIMIAHVGEAAVSGVSLVNTLSTLVFTLFSGLATGGSVLCAHYEGEGEHDKTAVVHKHMLVLVMIVSVGFMAVCFIGNRGLLTAIFGETEKEVMDNAVTYFWILVFSFPFLGYYNSSAAVLRGLGNSKIPLYASILMNIINVSGNAFLLYGLGWGVEGVAVPTLVSRFAAALMLGILMRNPQLHLKSAWRAFRWSWDTVKRILRVGVPGCLEMSIFQIGKILVLSLITRLGTTAISANAVGNTISSFETLPQDAIGLALVTVVGQCMGAGKKEQAVYYIKKLIAVAFVGMWIVNAAIFLGANVIIGWFQLTEYTTEVTVNVVRFCCICGMTVMPFAFAMPNALKGAYDVKYPLVVSMFSMWAFRVGLSYLAVNFFHADIYILYGCFACDWLFRAIMYGMRFHRRKWLEIRQA